MEESQSATESVDTGQQSPRSPLQAISLNAAATRIAAAFQQSFVDQDTASTVCDLFEGTQHFRCEAFISVSLTRATRQHVMC